MVFSRAIQYFYIHISSHTKHITFHHHHFYFIPFSSFPIFFFSFFLLSNNGNHHWCRFRYGRMRLKKNHYIDRHPLIHVHMLLVHTKGFSFQISSEGEEKKWKWNNIKIRFSFIRMICFCKSHSIIIGVVGVDWGGNGFDRKGNDGRKIYCEK